MGIGLQACSMLGDLGQSWRSMSGNTPSGIPRWYGIRATGLHGLSIVYCLFSLYSHDLSWARVSPSFLQTICGHPIPEAVMTPMMPSLIGRPSTLLHSLFIIIHFIEGEFIHFILGRWSFCCGIHFPVSLQNNLQHQTALTSTEYHSCFRVRRTSGQNKIFTPKIIREFITYLMAKAHRKVY